MGLTELSISCTTERPLSVSCFLCFFLSTGDEERWQKEHCAEGVLCMDTEMLSTNVEQFGSETGLRATSMSRTFS